MVSQKYGPPAMTGLGLRLVMTGVGAVTVRAAGSDWPGLVITVTLSVLGAATIDAGIPIKTSVGLT